MYLPIDFEKNANKGYTFINFVHPLFILDFQKEFEGKKWYEFKSYKICEVKYGAYQGLG